MKMTIGWMSLFAAAAVSGETVMVPDSISTGMEKDVTAELNEFLRKVPDGSTVKFPEKAEYRIEGTLLLEGRKMLTLEGNGTTFHATDPMPDYVKEENYGGWKSVRNRAHWRVKDSKGIVIRNMRVIGAYKDGGREGEYDYNREAQHAFDLLGVTDMLVESIHASDVYGDGVYISKESRGVTVRKCRIERTGRQGMAVGIAYGVLIEDNDILDSRRGLLDIEPYGKEWACGDVRVIGNRFGDSRLLALPMGGGGEIGAVLVANNVFKGPNGTPLVLHRTKSGGVKRGPFFFLGNTAQVGGSPAPGLRIGEVTGVLVAGNRIVFNAKREMSVLSVEQGPTGVFGNHFPGAEKLIGEEFSKYLVERGNSFEEGEAKPAEIAEVQGGYGVRLDLGDGSEVVGLMRAEGDKGDAVSAFGLSTSGQWAWELRQDGKVVEKAGN